MITYKAILRKNPKNGRTAYYATQVRLGQININELADDMSAESTVTRHDILAVLSSLQQHIIKNLQQGRSVRLGDLGSFHVDIVSRPSETEDKVTSENVKAVRVHFRKSGIMESQFQLTNSKMRFVNFNSILNEKAEDQNQTGA